MRVLHLTGNPEDRGGILTVIRNLSQATQARGDTHVVWVNSRYQETRRPELSYRQSKNLLSETDSHATLTWRALRALPELKRLLAQESFDVLHAHSRGALVLGLSVTAVLGRPVLFTNHAYARHRWLYRWASRRPRMRTSVLTPNMALFYGLTPKPGAIEVISECCADSLFEKPLADRPRDRAEEKIRLVGLGNIVRWKNWHVLLQAIRSLPREDWKRLEFDHWGPIPNEPACQAYAKELDALSGQAGDGFPVHFHGLSLKVDQVLRNADWFVLPSTNEPCSVALIEALAMGLPALVSASGGNIDIVQNQQTGLWFKPDSAADLADQLGRILRREIQPAAAGAIRDSVRHRSASKVAEDYSRIYAQLRLVETRGGEQVR